MLIRVAACFRGIFRIWKCHRRGMRCRARGEGEGAGAGRRRDGERIGTRGTCQSVELGRNSVNWTPGGSQTRLRAVAFDARITAGSNFNQITSVTRCFRYARTATDRSFTSLCLSRSFSPPPSLSACDWWVAMSADDGEIERTRFF